MKVGALQKKLISLTHNKIVLYILLAIALFNLIAYLGQNNLGAIVLFLIIGFGSTYYTKNMVLVLLLAIGATSILVKMGVLGLFGMREGMEGDEEASPSPSPEPDSNPESESESEADNQIQGDPIVSNSESAPSTVDDSIASRITADLQQLQVNNENNKSITDELSSLIAQTNQLMSQMSPASS